jgi:hypothetical protein
MIRRIWYSGGAMFIGILAVGCSFGGSASSDEVPPPSTTVVSNSAFVGCSECHADLDEIRSTDRPETLTFDHADHDAASDSVACGSCHPVETHVDTSTIKPAMATCYDCHGVDAIAPLPCSSCHPLSVVPRPPSHLDEQWGRVHSIVRFDSELACASCHSEEQFCDACHGLEMPHPEGWNEDDHTDASLEGGEDACMACHGSVAIGEARSDCDTCHHPGGAVEDPWLTAHPDVVNHEGGESCSTCHVQPDFCTACHGVELPHPDGWNEADHAVAFFEDEGDGCVVCHESDASVVARTECDTCHHPGGDPDDPWLAAHPDVVKYGDATCFTCHAQTTCVRCHVDGVKEFEADRTRFLESWITSAP